MAAVNNRCGGENVKPTALSAFFYALQLQVVLGSSGDHHRRGVEHGEEECNRAVNCKGEKRRRNRRKSSPERDHCNAQNCGLLDGRGAAKSLSHRMGEEGGTYRNNIGQWWWWWV